MKTLRNTNSEMNCNDESPNKNLFKENRNALFPFGWELRVVPIEGRDETENSSMLL